MAATTISFPITSTSSATDNMSASSSLTGYTGCQIVASAINATVQCQGSFDGGITWEALQLVNMNDATNSTGATAAGIYRADVGGVHQFRWKCSAFTSATSATAYITVREG